MKNILLVILASFLVVASKAQLLLDPVVYNNAKQDSIKTQFLHFKSSSPEYRSLRLPNQWTTVNINYLEVIDEEQFNPFKQKDFLSGLKYEDDEYVVQQIIDIDNKDISLAFIINQLDGFKLTIYNPEDSEFVYKINYLAKILDLEIVKIFYLRPFKEMFLVYNDKFYVVEKDNIYEAISYFRKKYKNKKGFIKQFRVRVY
ncbi:MAG TPA: hypothetical protein VLZ83_10965 [Edaphocola sp.]|nr:hypothetical protein [Edaphocola sp.]